VYYNGDTAEYQYKLIKNLEGEKNEKSKEKHA